MTTKKETPAPASEPNPSPKKEGLNKKWMIMVAFGAVVIFMLWVAGSMVDDGKDIISSVTTNKPAPAQVVAGNTASSTPALVAKGNVLPVSTAKDVATTPAMGEGSTAKVEVKAENGKLKVEFDPCACKTCSTPPKPPKVPDVVQSRNPAPTAPVIATTPTPSAGGSQLSWRHPDAEAGKGPRECFFEKVDRSHLEQYQKYCTKGIRYPKKDASESRTTWNERVNQEWSEKYRKEGEPALVKTGELDSVTYKVRPGT